MSQEVGKGRKKRTNMKHNPESPWNPSDPLEISPEDYEREVLRWLSKASAEEGLDICLEHRKVVGGQSGDYQIDVTGKFTVFKGAAIKVLVECKRHGRPVKRDDVLAFAKKIENTESHKGMMFSTSGFQRGALAAAKPEGIALVTFVDGKFNYETRSAGTDQEPPGWVDFPRYGGMFLTMNGMAIGIRSVGFDELDPIVEWIRA